MASLFMNNKVVYFCSCGTEKPITKIYFCRYCTKIRCGECSSHEVDSNYCPNCLEYMPSQEARLKKNRCANCLDCPSCFHTLSTRASTIQMPSTEDPSKAVPKKVHYLFCGFCRWTSRDVGLQDQFVATGGWQEPEIPNSKRINLLLEHYRVLAQKEKLEKERKKISQKIGILHFSDKYGISPVVAKKLAGLTSATHGRDNDSKLSEDLVPAEVQSTIEEFPISLLTEPLDLMQVTSLAQRLRKPENQSPIASKMMPQHKYLLIKKSLRCKGCEHNLSKPEYNPISIKFKLYLAAIYHIPEIRLKTIPAFSLNKSSRVEITLTNPTNSLVHITFQPFNDHAKATAHVEVPKVELVLAAKDDTAEYDDITDNNPPTAVPDDAEVISFRKSNKLGFYLHCTPKSKDQDVRVALKMRHDLWNMTPPQGDSQQIWLDHVLLLNLGSL